MTAASDISLTDIADKVNRARSLVELVYMAGHYFLSSDREAANAVTTGCDVVDSFLVETTGMIETMLGAEDDEKPDAPVQVPDTIDAILARMSLDGLHQAYDGLGTIHSVVSGLLSQPRYQKGDSETLLNDAGEILEQAISEVAGGLRDRIIRLAEDRPAKSKVDNERKFALLAGQYIDGLSEPKAALECIQHIAACMGKGGQS